MKPQRLGADQVIALLGRTMLFGSLPAANLAGLEPACTQRSYARAQFVYHQGDPGDRLFIVAAGRVKVLYTSEQGDEMVLATLGVGDTFGELAVLDGSARSASVITVTPTVVFMITRAALLEVVSSSPEFVDAVFAGLGGTVRRLTEQASDLASLDLGGRLAKLLYRLAEERGRAREEAVLDLQLNQSEIASMVGASRPAVNRTLQSLVTRGVLSVDGQMIVLHDLSALRRRAGL